MEDIVFNVGDRVFNVGDRVVCVQEYDGNGDIVGVTGTVVQLFGTRKFGVRWDLEKPNGTMHSCGGTCENGYGWYVVPSVVKRINDDIEDAMVAASMELLFA